MRVEDYIIQKPLTNAQARQGINLMRRMESERALEALREQVAQRNLMYWVNHGDMRDAQNGV